MNQDPFENFIKELNDSIKSNYQTVAYAFENEYGWPEVDSVRSEICKCIICGLYFFVSILNCLSQTFCIFVTEIDFYG